MSQNAFKYIWYWYKKCPGRKGQVCRVLTRGTMNSILIEFKDGGRYITSANGIRKMKFQPGDQIVYVPNHADGPDHPDAEEGFVTSANGYYIFCRYWSKIYPGQLRTKANSEATMPQDLIKKKTRPQSAIAEQMRIINAK
jgi:hypothetical protein